MAQFELSPRCRSYLDGARTFDAMTAEEFGDRVEASGFDPADFALVLAINAACGGKELPAGRPGASSIRVGLAGGPLRIDGDVYVPFVAPPEGPLWMLHVDGRLVAPDPQSEARPPSAIAESFEVLLEGLALEYESWQRFGEPVPDFLRLNDLVLNLPRSARVEAASDAWTTWWFTDRFAVKSCVDDAKDWVKAWVWSDDGRPRVSATREWLARLSSDTSFTS